MRFHHSTRRGRNRHYHQQQQHQQQQHNSRVGVNKWSQLSYCRETNIHFNRRLPVELPECLRSSELHLVGSSFDDYGAQFSAHQNLLDDYYIKDSQVEEAVRRLHLSETASYNPSSEEGATSDRRYTSRRTIKENNKMTYQDRSAIIGTGTGTGITTSETTDKLDMEIAREKLVNQVKKHTFWSSKAARRMQLTGTECRRIYIYELVSFCERRELEWRFQPYRGGLGAAPSGSLPLNRALALSGSASPGIGPATAATATVGEPHPELVWAIETPGGLKPEPFAGYVVSSELPDSSFVKRCHGCQGRGRLKCSSCYGVGYEVCISCSGKGTTKGPSGYRGGLGRSADSAGLSSGARGATSDDDPTGADANEGRGSSGRGSGGDEPGGIGGGSSGGSGGWSGESCHFCHGAGQKRCWVCSGRSYNCCSACQGASQLRCYLNLTITWLNHRDEVILNNSDDIIKRDRLRLSSGVKLIEQNADRLKPLPVSLSPPTPTSSHLNIKINSSGQHSRALDGATSWTTNSQQATVPDPNEWRQVSQVSRKLLERHRENYGLRERIIRQRHQLTQYECHIVRYEWKQRRGHFVVYGNERKVYIAKYPFKSLCNIT